MGINIDFWTNAKTITEFLLSFTLLFSTCTAIFMYKFKLGADERKLYTENAQTVRKVLLEIVHTAVVKDDDIFTLKRALLDAQLYLDKNIVDYIEEILNVSIDTSLIQGKMENVPQNEYRKILCSQDAENKIKLAKAIVKLPDLYRKHIVSDPIITKLPIINRFTRNKKKG